MFAPPPEVRRWLHSAAVLAAERRLLPPPPAVKHWLAGGGAFSSDGSSRMRVAIAAGEWLVDAVSNAHLSRKLKKAARDLLAQVNFTANLEHLNVWDPILQPRLEKRLQSLGEEAAASNAATGLAVELTSARVAEVSVMHKDYPAGAPRNAVRQDAAMPIFAQQFDWVGIS